MNFDQHEVDEYVSSDEDAGKVDYAKNMIIEENKQNNNIRGKKQDIIIQSFKPGKCHAGMRQFPQSIEEIKVQEPMATLTFRKLPAVLQEKQRKCKNEMIEVKKAPMQTEVAKARE